MKHFQKMIDSVDAAGVSRLVLDSKKVAVCVFNHTTLIEGANDDVLGEQLSFRRTTIHPESCIMDILGTINDIKKTNVIIGQEYVCPRY